MVGRVHTALSGQQPSGSCAHPIRESTGTLAKIPCNLRDFFFSLLRNGQICGPALPWCSNFRGLVHIEQDWKGLWCFQGARSQHRLVLCTAI